jgi:aminoglycoside phosphotransferase (APT) family kinase protein
VRRLPGGLRSSVWELAAEPPLVLKLATPDRVAREARALRRAVPLGLAPALVAADGPLLVSARALGRSRPTGMLPPRQLRALGAAVRRVHDLRHGASGGWSHWPSRVRSLRAYRARYAAEAAVAAREAGRVELAATVLAALPPLPSEAARPFRWLHGDLWSGNVLWDRGAPLLVDWEDARPGDPAEELAYLAEMDALPGPALALVLEGYDVAGMAERIVAWRPLVALSAGLWYLAEGVPERAEALLRQARARVRHRQAPSRPPTPRARARPGQGPRPSG